MKLTIIRDMGLVHVDGRGHDEVDVSAVPEDVHAVQWHETEGQIEYIDNTPNLEIDALPSWASDLANEMVERLATEDAEEAKSLADAEAYANSPEGKAEAIRSERDRLISETDWWAVADRTMTQEQSDYRQALRDITNQETFPESVDWPVKP